ncbi:DUF6278 family protein [Kitasatospora sp. DSM 101779]|uniref:DUF6278 family protein n=1 Tax=Kitasatospora sp. DSM 101779 TaxID=2853165 RepID=UPI0021D99205|nr:DUF6278 family protein [Kitasatospora sp. DSM 101779]MCU7824696.1 hypothetical protein [Kitasatospora sp. DSM 101779]
MGIGFLDRWRARHAHHPGGIPPQPDEPTMAALLAECGLLRDLADDSGVRLDDGVTSLTQLDQLLPRWRDDPEVSEWLGNDAGLYLGTVLHRSVPGTVWRLDEHDRPLVVLPGGRELDVTAIGHGWAVEGSPQLATAYLAATDG